jgi:hypothetical protein
MPPSAARFAPTVWTEGQIRQDAGQELWGITLPVLP